MNVATRGIRNAFRNVTRTLSIVTILGMSIGLSLIMLIANQAVDNKIKSVMETVNNSISISPAGSGVSTSVIGTLTTTQLKKAENLEHVKSLTMTLRMQLQTTGTTAELGGATMRSTSSSSTTITTSLKSSLTLSGLNLPPGMSVPTNFSQPITLVGSSRPTDPTTVGASSLTITSGKAIDGNKDTNDAMISTTMATKNNLSVGSTFTADNETFTVVAIFDGKTQSANDMVIVSLPTVQRLTSQAGQADSASITVDSLANLSSVTDKIKSTLGTSADVKSDVDQAKKTLQPLDGVKSVSMFSLIGAAIASAIITLLTMIMIVRERLREIGILKAIGFSNVRIMLQFMCEALTFTILGTIVGLAIGFFGASPGTSSLVSSSSSTSGPGGGAMHMLGGDAVSSALSNFKDVHAQIGWSVIGYGFGAAILIALIGSALAAYFISKVRPAQVLRSE